MSTKIKVTLAHGAFVDGKYVPPGTECSVTHDEAAALRAGGYVVGDEGEVSGAAAATRT